VDGAADPPQLLFESVTTCPYWALMASPSAVPYLLTRAALIWAADMLVPDAGSTDTTAIAFPNDMSRSTYPMAHDSWLALPPEPASAVNWLTSAGVHWPGADPWAGAAAPPPPHAVTVNAVTAAASDPASRSCFLCALMNTMIPPLYPSQSSLDRLRFFRQLLGAALPPYRNAPDEVFAAKVNLAFVKR
jgi:hypothetical protein